MNDQEDPVVEPPEPDSITLFLSYESVDPVSGEVQSRAIKVSGNDSTYHTHVGPADASQNAYLPSVSIDGRTMMYFVNSGAGSVVFTTAGALLAFEDGIENLVDNTSVSDVMFAWSRDGGYVFFTPESRNGITSWIMRVDPKTLALEVLLDGGYRLLGRARGDTLLVRSATTTDMFKFEPSSGSLSPFNHPFINASFRRVDWSEEDGLYIFEKGTRIGYSSLSGDVFEIISPTETGAELRLPRWGIGGQILFSQYIDGTEDSQVVVSHNIENNKSTVILTAQSLGISNSNVIWLSDVYHH